MFSVPSFLSWPFSLPQLPSISLPANIQRRFLSYVLKRSLGRFVKEGSLDVERIQAQISQGWVEIEDLEVDTTAINALLPASLLALNTGSISRVTARVPFPNLWTDPLSLCVDGLTLEFGISSVNSRGKRPETAQSPPSSANIDLSASVTSAADDFLHDEIDAYEGAELDRSIRQSILLSSNDPFTAVNDDVPGSFPFNSPAGDGQSSSPLASTVETKTALAGLVERILARLTFKVKNVKVRLRVQDGARGSTFELRVAEVNYADESVPPAGAEVETVRSVRVSGMAVYVLDEPSALVETPPPVQQWPYQRSFSSSTASSTATDDGADMAMSLAVADLRQSKMSASAVSGKSVYQSATSQTLRNSAITEDESDDDSNDQFASAIDDTPVIAQDVPIIEQQPGPVSEPKPTDTLILSFGQDDIVLQLRTTMPAPNSVYADAPISKSAIAATPRQAMPSMTVSVTIGTISSLLTPALSIRLLSSLAVISTHRQEGSSRSSVTATTISKPQPRLQASLSIKGVYIAGVYDMAAEDDDRFDESVAQFYARPASTFVPWGHLKLKAEAIDATYSFRGFTPRTDAASGPGRPLVRRQSTGVRVEPPPADVSLTLGDISIFEYLATDSAATEDDPTDTIPGGAYPVLLFDTNLLRQYDLGSSSAQQVGRMGLAPAVSTSAPVFPEFEGLDWRNSGLQKKTGSIEKVWKVRTRPRGGMKGARESGTAEGAAVSVRLTTADAHPIKVDTLPLHLFFDLSLVERLLPVMRHTSKAVLAARMSPLDSPRSRVKHVDGLARPVLASERSSSYVLDDLDAQATSDSTIRPAGGPTAEVTCPLVRLDIRCPAPLARRGTWGDGAHLRSGIVTLDVHALRISVGGGKDQISTRAKMETQDVAAVTWSRMLLFFSRVPTIPSLLQEAISSRVPVSSPLPLAATLLRPHLHPLTPGTPFADLASSSIHRQSHPFFPYLAPSLSKANEFSDQAGKKAKAICIIGPLAPDPSELIDQEPLPPVVDLKKTVNLVNGITSSTVTCRIPNIQAKVDQTTIEGLQFFADDLTHWLDGAFGDGSAPKPRDDLKMIGSRFFGSKASSSASSSDDELEDPTAATVLKLQVTEVDVALHVPRVADPFAIDVSTERILGLHASDMDVRIESNIAGKQETTLNLCVMDATFADRSSNIDILRRTVPLSLTMNTSPLVALRFTSLTNIATLTKETGITVTCTTAAVFVTRDLGWIKELKSFARTPEGVFEDVVPSEVTRISLKLYDCSIHVATPTLSGALLVVLGAVDLRTDVISDAEESLMDIGVEQVHLLAIDERAAAVPLTAGYHQTSEAWKRAGYAQLLSLDCDVRVIRAVGMDTQATIDVLDSAVDVTLCADSLATLGQLAGDLGNFSPTEQPRVDEMSKPSKSSLSESINVFGSVDDEAFRQLPDLTSGLDLVEDDLPNNLDYLDSTAARRVKNTDAAHREGIRSWQTEHDENAAPADSMFAAEVKGETVKVLVDGPVELIEHYWDSLPVLAQSENDETLLGDIRVRLHQCAISVQLFDGYDWQKTRKTIEDEIKAMRRRLERIRQLLASGQKADESIEHTSSTLFNSIYIGVDQRNDMDTAALLKAIDDELDGLGDDTASQSSWQTMPVPGSAEKRSKVRLRGKRLTRSKKPQIEFGLKGLRAELDQYAEGSATAMRLQVQAAAFEILDHIKTSTWKKFLTEMKADSRGNVRETDADMLRVEFLKVRPNLPDPGEEIRIKAKILPLRLHVDQDALDFLKTFFGFQTPTLASNAEATAAPSRTVAKVKTSEPFFQYVEIYPIELKLDYKPKRVDLAALRQGKTIELMNFFHFDGAEMTLRHITLSGITGVEHLSTLLQDIWTPDVKANQLADVISGVSPIRSMVNVGSGVADLILLPIEQYRKDGRVARGVQRGTNSFVRSTAMEMMKLGARLATGTQVILEKAEGVLGGKFGQDVVGEVGTGARHAAPLESDDEDAEVVDLVSRYADQPMDVRQGVQAAYKSLSKNVNEAAQTILAVPMEVYERSGDSGPLRAVVRAVPVAVLRPMIGASEAVSKTLLGARNSLDPRSKAELSDKYKRGTGR